MYYVLIGIFNVIFWSLQPLLEKQAVNITNEPFNMLNIRYIIAGIMSLIFFLYYNKNQFNNYSYKVYAIMILVSFLGFGAKYFNYILLNKYEASFVSAIVSPLIIITTLLFGILFFNEKINIQKIIGIFIICIGMFILLFNNNNK